GIPKLAIAPATTMARTPTTTRYSVMTSPRVQCSKHLAAASAHSRFRSLSASGGRLAPAVTHFMKVIRHSVQVISSSSAPSPSRGTASELGFGAFCAEDKRAASTVKAAKIWLIIGTSGDDDRDSMDLGDEVRSRIHAGAFGERHHRFLAGDELERADREHDA